MPHRTARAVLAGLSAAGLAVGLAAAPAQAAGAPLVDGLAGPLAISVDHGKLYVAQSFGGMLTRYGLDGSGGKVLVQRRPKVEVGAVQAQGPGLLFAVTGKNKHGKFAKLKHRAADGSVSTVADMRGFEKRINPDKHVTYNFRDISDSCAKKVPEQVGGASYTGKVDSHPYATARMADGTVVVADAAGNDIVTVSPSGFRTEIATLPAQPLRVTRALAHKFGMPACVVGHKFWFEPVPTDVEVHDGMLYVSVLPGGPEDPSLGARGKVYTVNPRSGAVKQIGKGFVSATDLAVSPKGKVYVTELFANQVSTIKDGVAKKVKAFKQPAAIEWYRGRLFVAGGLEGPGYVDVFRP